MELYFNQKMRFTSSFLGAVSYGVESQKHWDCYTRSVVTRFADLKSKTVSDRPILNIQMGKNAVYLPPAIVQSI